MVTIEEKRAQIKRSEERIDYFIRMMTERPRLMGIWVYWQNWYRVRRADWLAHLWLQRCRAWKKEVRRWERPGEEPDLKRAEVIGKNVSGIEDGITVIEPELRDTAQLARARRWRVRWPAPTRTMTRWIGNVRRRISRVRHWIKEIRKELPALWKKFVYTIYYSYTLPGSERHLEAHMHSQCHVSPDVQAKVKRLANKLLRLWVSKPITTWKGIEKPGYAVPLLVPPGIARPPYEGTYRRGYAEWRWGCEWYTTLEEHKVKPAPAETKVKEEVIMLLELFDFDYLALRMFSTYKVPPVWWAESQEELEKRLKVGIYMLRRFVEREEE